jgi:hypothetical protein
MMGLCQRCGDARDSWTVKQARFHVGRIEEWKIQLCNACSESVEQAVLVALRMPTKP